MYKYLLYRYVLGVITTEALMVPYKMQYVEVEGVCTLRQEALCLHPAFYQFINLG